MTDGKDFRISLFNMICYLRVQTNEGKDIRWRLSQKKKKMI